MYAIFKLYNWVAFVFVITFVFGIQLKLSNKMFLLYNDQVSVEEEELSDEEMEVLADIVTADAIGGADLGDEGGEEGADEAGGEEEEEDPNEFVHVDEKFYYLVNMLLLENVITLKKLKLPIAFLSLFWLKRAKLEEHKKILEIVAGKQINWFKK